MRMTRRRRTSGTSQVGPDEERPAAPETSGAEPVSGAQRFRRRFLGNRTAVVALAVLALIVAAAIFAPVLAPYDPAAIDVSDRLRPPSGDHWLGTDDVGRDVLSRLLMGARWSLGAAAMATSISFLLGTPFGLLAGYLGGRSDMLLCRLADALMSFPSLILAIGIIAAMGPGLTNAMVALGIVYAPRMFRVVRSATLSVRAETFIEASVSVGSSTGRVIRRHVLPNVMSPLIVQLSLMMAFALLAEASLSFLGLGVTPPDASWGVMLGRAFRDVRVAPYLIYWPGLAIAITTLSFNIVGDGLRDALGRELRTAKGKG